MWMNLKGDIIMEFNSISRVVYDYSKYVEAQEKNGEEAVSFFKYAFGSF